MIWTVFAIFSGAIVLHLIFYAFTGIAFWGPSPSDGQWVALILVHILALVSGIGVLAIPKRDWP